MIENIFQPPVISTANIALSGIEEMTDAAKTVITLQHALYNNVKEEDVQQHQ